MWNAASTWNRLSGRVRLAALALLVVGLLTPALAVGGPLAPPAPAGLTVTGGSTSTISVSWSPSAGATAYLLERDGRRVNITSATSYTFTGLECGKSYSLSVRALASGSYSSESKITGSTSACSGGSGGGGGGDGGTTSATKTLHPVRGRSRRGGGSQLQPRLRELAARRGRQRPGHPVVSALHGRRPVGLGHEREAAPSLDRREQERPVGVRHRHRLERREHHVRQSPEPHDRRDLGQRRDQHRRLGRVRRQLGRPWSRDVLLRARLVHGRRHSLRLARGRQQAAARGHDLLERRWRRSGRPAAPGEPAHEPAAPAERHPGADRPGCGDEDQLDHRLGRPSRGRRRPTTSASRSTACT